MKEEDSARTMRQRTKLERTIGERKDDHFEAEFFNGMGKQGGRA